MLRLSIHSPVYGKPQFEYNEYSMPNNWCINYPLYESEGTHAEWGTLFLEIQWFLDPFNMRRDADRLSYTKKYPESIQKVIRKLLWGQLLWALFRQTFRVMFTFGFYLSCMVRYSMRSMVKKNSAIAGKKLWRNCLMGHVSCRHLVAFVAARFVFLGQHFIYSRTCL